MVSNSQKNQARVAYQSNALLAILFAFASKVYHGHVDIKRIFEL